MATGIPTGEVQWSVCRSPAPGANAELADSMAVDLPQCVFGAGRPSHRGV
jgi:hypothetical protein